MRQGKRRSRTALIVGGAFGMLLACGSSTTDDDNFREDVLDCENAVARLSDCCPGFRSRQVECLYHFHEEESSGCGESSASRDEITPALSTAESDCIHSTSCAALQATGVCTRAQNALTYEAHYASSSTTPVLIGPTYDASSASGQSHPPVCP